MSSFRFRYRCVRAVRAVRVGDAKLRRCMTIVVHIAAVPGARGFKKLLMYLEGSRWFCFVICRGFEAWSICFVHRYMDFKRHHVKTCVIRTQTHEYVQNSCK